MAALPPDFRSRDFLLKHVQHTMDFYHPRAVDPLGGFYHYYKDDGTVYDAVTRHLVSSTRFIFNYSMAYQHFHREEYLQGVKHGLAFLRNVHRDPITRGYAWVLRFRDGQSEIEDPTNHCYGLAFVLLAYACAFRAGCVEGKEYLSETFDRWSNGFGHRNTACMPKRQPAIKTLFPYRGQNANMHGCEALIAAFEATREPRYLERAADACHITLRRRNFPKDLSEKLPSRWLVDRDTIATTKPTISTVGYQPGHLTEWAKLLLILDRHKDHLEGDTDWLIVAPENYSGWDGQSMG